MIYAPPWLQIARADALRGVLEQPGPNQNHPRILAMHAHCRLHATTDEVPWCSAAVSTWLDEAGRESTKSARARSYLNWGIHLPDPAFGCIVVLKRGRGRQPGPEVLDAPGHVGLLIDVIGDDVVVLGGNQSDSVCERPYKIERVLGYRWPGQNRG